MKQEQDAEPVALLKRPDSSLILSVTEAFRTRRSRPLTVTHQGDRPCLGGDSGDLRRNQNPR